MTGLLFEPGHEEDVAPRPSTLIESLRSFGYTPATSVADLIDNSLSAGAGKVAVNFQWDGPDSWMSIADDGHGMSAEELREAMRAGSSNPLEGRTPTDLGRFGLGLKTASFAQARSLTVMTRRHKEPVACRRWDLDHVQRTNRWALLTTPPAGTNLVELMLDCAGTLVVWHAMDRIVDDRPATDGDARKAFFRTVDEVREHLEMVFHRFIAEEHLDIRVNGVRCEAWDPFLSGHPLTERLPNESLPVLLTDGRRQRLEVQPYVLPHRSSLAPEEHRKAAGPRGWNMQQGFYLYRARRLIVPGNWFDRGMKPEEHHKLARIRVEITQEMDGLWALDVRKARARPPSQLQRDFQRIARATRERAESVYRARGRREVGQEATRKRVQPVWRVESDGRTVSYRIARDHPIVERVLGSLTGRYSKDIGLLITLIERNVPIAHILSQGYRDEDKLQSDPEIDGDLLDAARDLFCHLLREGREPDTARAVVSAVQPFDRAPALVDALEEGDCT